MSIFKSKFLLGVMIVAVMVAGVVFAMPKTSSAACDLGTTTLRLGMKANANVACLQTMLNVTPAVGNFGPLTLKAVKAFQTTNSLKADGVVGAMTKAALTATTAVVTPTTTTTTTTTTGDLCPNGNTLASNCATAPTAPTATTTTTSLCPNGMTLASNCVTAPTITTTTGAAGSIAVTTYSGDNNSNVTLGNNDQIVYGFKVEADGSNVNIPSLSVSLRNMASGTAYRLSSYASTVSIYEGSTKVGTANVSDFTSSINSSGQTEYTKSIALTGATVTAGTANKAIFYVEVSPISVMDSANSANSWSVMVSDLRYVDGTGLTISTTPDATTWGNESTFNFEKLATSGTVKYNLSASNAPAAQNVPVSSTTTTSNVLLNEFTLKATGSPLTFNKFVVTVTPSTGVNLNDITSELKLVDTSVTNPIATLDTIPSANTANQDLTFALDNTYTIPQDTTKTFAIYAKVNKVTTGTFVSGKSITATVSASKQTDVEDINGDAVTGANYITGTSIGNDQTFFANGINVSAFSTGTISTTSATSGAYVSENFPVTFSVSAFGQDYYVPVTGATWADTFSSGGSAGTLSSSNLTSSATKYTIGGADYYFVPNGNTVTFSASVTITAPAHGYQTVGLTRLAYGTSDGSTYTADAGSPMTLTPASSYQTGSGVSF